MQYRDCNGDRLHKGNRVVVLEKEFPNLHRSHHKSPYGTVTSFGKWIYIDRDDGSKHAGYDGSSIMLLDKCSRCEKDSPMDGDYLCHKCRYGV